MFFKRICLFLLLALILATGNTFARERGDLLFNLEPQIGVALPDIGIKLGDFKLSDLGYRNESVIGLDLALRATLHYYFFHFFGINAGAGVKGFISQYEAQDWGGDWHVQNFAGIYASIPLGVRFSLGALAAGGGITANIPFFAQSEMWYRSGGHTSNRERDNGFELSTYMGWYADIGFDLSGRSGRTGGFGLLLRVSGSFDDSIAKSSIFTEYGRLSYNPFRYLAISLVFQGSTKVASLPIGGN